MSYSKHHFYFFRVDGLIADNDDSVPNPVLFIHHVPDVKFIFPQIYKSKICSGKSSLTQENI